MAGDNETATFHLAVLRTELANSRTLLAHIQASIALLVSAIAFMKLFDLYLIFYVCCWLLIVVAIAVICRGIFLYRKTKLWIEKQKEIADKL